MTETSVITFIFLLVITLIGLGYLLHRSGKKQRTELPIDPIVVGATEENQLPIVFGGRAVSGRSQTKPKALPKKVDRAELKARCLELLDAMAIEHPAGHGKLCARYIMRTQDGDRIELMFERGDNTRPHLWMAEKHARSFISCGAQYREYPAVSLYRPAQDSGKPTYGRHSALKAMRDLANADLIRFTIDTSTQLEFILARLGKAKENA